MKVEKCVHGSLKHKCELCERDDVILRLETEIDRLNTQLATVREDNKYAWEKEDRLEGKVARLCKLCGAAEKILRFYVSGRHECVLPPAAIAEMLDMLKSASDGDVP